MIPLSLDALAAAMGGAVVAAPDDAARRRFDRVVTDSRALRVDGQHEGGAGVFVALPGEHADGHQFVDAAIGAGARAVVVDRDLPWSTPLGDAAVVRVADTWQALRALAHEVRNRVAPDTVAITGSLGKTTVKDLAAAAVGARRRVHAAHGSFNNELGVPLTLLGLDVDDEVLVTEIGARRPGDVASLADLVAPDIAVVTAIAPVHLEIFGTIDAIARTKGELVGALGPTGVAVLNTADPRVAAMAAHAPATIRVARDDLRADVHARNLRVDGHARPRATAVTPWGSTELVLPIAGIHQMTNGLLALAVAGHLGVEVDAAAAALATAPVSPWRGEVVQFAGLVVLDDGYNANPTAMESALQTLVAIERTGASIAVLGLMGEIGPTSVDEHRRIGRRCVELDVDQVVVVGPKATPIASGAREAGHTDVVEIADPVSAGDHLADRMQPGDVALVKASRAAGLEVVAQRLRARRAPAGTEERR